MNEVWKMIRMMKILTIPLMLALVGLIGTQHAFADSLEATCNFNLNTGQASYSGNMTYTGTAPPCQVMPSETPFFNEKQDLPPGICK